MATADEERAPRWTQVALFSFTLLALWLRLRGLTDQPLWFDEVLTIVRSDAPTPLGVLAHQLADCQVPLYDLLMWAVTQLFGTGELAARLPSALLGTALVPATWVLARATFGGFGSALIAAPLVAVAPVVVAYGQEARQYALFALLTALVLLAATRLVKSRGERGGWLLACCGPLLLLTHYYALFVVAAVVLAFVWHLGALRERTWRVAAALLPTLVAAFLWSPIALWQFTRDNDAPVYAMLGARGMLAALDTWTLEGAAAYRDDLSGCWFVQLGLAAIGALMLVARRRSDEPDGACEPVASDRSERRLHLVALMTLTALFLGGMTLFAIVPVPKIEALAGRFLRGGRELDQEGRAFVASLRPWMLGASSVLPLLIVLLEFLPAIARRCSRERASAPLLPLSILLPLAGVLLIDALGTKTFASRHTIYAAAPLAVLVGGAVAAARRFAVAIALTGLLVANGARALRSDVPIHEHPDFRGVAALLRDWSLDAPLAFPKWTGRCIEHYGGRPWYSVFGTDELDAARRFAADHERVVFVTSYGYLGAAAPMRLALAETHRILQIVRFPGVCCERFEKK